MAVGVKMDIAPMQKLVTKIAINTADACSSANYPKLPMCLECGSQSEEIVSSWGEGTLSESPLIFTSLTCPTVSVETSSEYANSGKVSG